VSRLELSHTSLVAEERATHFLFIIRSIVLPSLVRVIPSSMLENLPKTNKLTKTAPPRIYALLASQHVGFGFQSYICCHTGTETRELRSAVAAVRAVFLGIHKVSVDFHIRPIVRGLLLRVVRRKLSLSVLGWSSVVCG
jgi:hypothetical protein